MDMDPAERGRVEWVSEFCPVKGSIRHACWWLPSSPRLLVATESATRLLVAAESATPLAAAESATPTDGCWVRHACW